MPIDWIPDNGARRVGPARAIAGLRRLAQAQPGSAETTLLLAQALLDDGQAQACLEVLDGIEGSPSPQARLTEGRAAFLLRDHARAVPALRAAADFGLARADGELAQALMQSGLVGEAESAARRGLARTPADIASLRVLGTLLMERGDAAGAYALAGSLWKGGTHRAQVVWTLAWSARALGREAEFQSLAAREPWFAAEHLTLDNDALAREILANEALAPSPGYKPTQGAALRLENLETIATPAIGALHGAVRAAIERYRSTRLGHVTHPLIEGWPARMRLESWALAMRDDGFENWHVHVSAWLSAVYYVHCPAGVGKAGSLGFGALPVAARWPGPPFPEWQIRPERGLLVIFPAWYAHRTWPTGERAERISVAFNAVPA